MRVVVMGCGRVGASLSDSLARIGHDVAVIDRDSTAFNRLPVGRHWRFSKRCGRGCQFVAQRP